MTKVTFSSKWGSVKVQKKPVSPAAEADKSAEECCPGNEKVAKTSGR